MIKRKPYSENAIFVGRWHPLSDAAQTQIAKLLQLTPGTASHPLGLLSKVELILGSRDGVARTLGHPPVAADYVRTMTSIQRKCHGHVAELNIAGNLVTADMIQELILRGADIVKG